MNRLSARLSLVARLAGSGGSVIDVGADHGYIPVWLAENGRFDRVAASDIGAGPLAAARASARAAGVEDRIRFYLTDGLKDVPGRFDTVILAGMGGETMVDILSACPWIGEARLVLQPQSKLPELEGWLDRAGFIPEDAALVADGGRLYTAFRAAAGEGGFDLLRALTERRDPLLPGALAGEKARLDRALAGMARGGRGDDKGSEELSHRRERVERAVLEVSTWQR